MCPKVLRNLASLVFFPQKGKVSFNDDGSRNYSIINVAQMISCKHVRNHYICIHCGCIVAAGNITETLIGQLSTITEPTLAPIFPNGKCQVSDVYSILRLHYHILQIIMQTFRWVS